MSPRFGWRYKWPFHTFFFLKARYIWYDGVVVVLLLCEREEERKGIELRWMFGEKENSHSGLDELTPYLVKRLVSFHTPAILPFSLSLLDA